MKTKNTIQIVETPVIDKYDFHESNGIINPAFLNSYPDGEETGSSRALVDSDYRHNFQLKNSQQSAVQYPADDLIIEHRPNGTSVASSWVYEFNKGSTSNSPGHNMTNSTPNLHNGLYRSYGMGYNEHLSYEMDLSRDHRKNTKEEEGCAPCWPTCVKLFVWTIIVVCVMGVFLSIGFIIYIEKFAADNCCSDNTTNSTSSHSPNYKWISGNVTIAGLEYSSERITDSTPTLIDMTTGKSDLNTSLSNAEWRTTPKVTTNSFIGTNADNSSSDLLTTQTSLEINGQNSNLELNVTEGPSASSETTKIESNSSTTTPTSTEPTSITTHSAPTSQTKKPSKHTSSAPTSKVNLQKPINKTTEKTKKSTFDSRVLTTKSSPTPKPNINFTETVTSGPITGNKSIEYSSTTTSSPEETTTNNSIETTTDIFDIVAEIVDEIENSPTLHPTHNHTTSAVGNVTLTSSTATGSDFTTANYNKTEPAINHMTGDNNDTEKTTTTTETITTEATTTTTNTTVQPTTTNSEN